MAGSVLHRVRRPVGRRGGARGGVAIEFALVAPLLLTLLAAIVDLGYAAYQSMQVQAAAEAGARHATQYGWDPAGISDAVTGATGIDGIAASPAPSLFCGCADAGGITQVACDGTCPGGGAPAQYARVSAELVHETVLPYPGLPDPLTLRGYSIVRLQ